MAVVVKARAPVPQRVLSFGQAPRALMREVNWSDLVIVPETAVAGVKALPPTTTPLAAAELPKI